MRSHLNPPDQGRPVLTAVETPATVLVNMSDMFTTLVPEDPTAGNQHDEPTGAAAMCAPAAPLLDGRACACGALAEERQTTCRKCRARGRWQRRAAARARRAADVLLVTLAVLAVLAVSGS